MGARVKRTAEAMSCRQWHWRQEAILLIVVAYMLLPLVAGFLSIGFKSGPKVYPRWYHVGLYTVGYEIRFREKPRELWCERRPWFYGARAKAADPETEYRKLQQRLHEEMDE